MLDKLYECLQSSFIKFSYCIIYIYTYVTNCFNHYTNDYKLINIKLFNESINEPELLTLTKFKIKNNKYTFKDLNIDYKLILIKYSFNKIQFQLVIKSNNLNDINKYYPPYDVSELSEIDLNIKPILVGTLKNKDDTEKDITDEVNELAGPKQDFYKTLSEFELPEIYDLWGKEALEAILLTGNVEEIKLNNNKPQLKLDTIDELFPERKLSKVVSYS